MGATAVIVIVIGLALVLVFIIGLAATMFRKVGPNEALIVYGFGGKEVVVGGGKVVLPFVQQAELLSLELMSFDVAPTQDLYTSQGVAVNVEAVAQIKVQSDQESILKAAEQFLAKPPQERQALIRLVMEGHLRGIVGQLTVEQIVKEPEMVGERMRANVADDIQKMGLVVVSFTIREVKDKNDYILNMGKPDVAYVQRNADVATAEADRDTTIKRAQAMREAKIAEAIAEQEKVIAETASQTRQAEAIRDLEIKRAEYASTVKAQQAQADKAYEIQTNIEQQRAIAEEVKVEQVRKHGEIAVQEAEILRREKELIATVLRAAEIEKQRIETLAEAERQRKVLQATGEAESVRLDGQAQAEVTRLKGVAEAEIILAKGNAEANAMNVQAEAYQLYNQAAVLDKLLTSLPEVVRAISEPLTKVDKITVVSTGGENGHGTGVNRVTTDMATMIAQVPALIESLTGVKIDELMKQVPAMRQPGESTNGYAPRDGSPAPLGENAKTPAAVPAPEADSSDQ
ncbi:MAG: flotillin family protein [Thermomicrobiales bacterium]